MIERCDKFDIIPHWKTMTFDEHISALKEKLIEESKEVAQAHNTQELIAELADVQEVLDVLIKKLSLSQKQILEKQKEKVAVRGSFEKGIFAHHIDVIQGTDWHEYCSSEPEKYPIIKEIID